MCNSFLANRQNFLDFNVWEKIKKEWAVADDGTKSQEGDRSDYSEEVML